MVGVQKLHKGFLENFHRQNFDPRRIFYEILGKTKAFFEPNPLCEMKAFQAKFKRKRMFHCGKSCVCGFTIQHAFMFEFNFESFFFCFATLELPGAPLRPLPVHILGLNPASKNIFFFKK